jgi:capsular exopolysaccharide synthesis family protein
VEATAQTTLLAQSTLDQILNPAESLPGEQDRQENALKNHLSMMTSRRFQLLLLSSFTPAEAAAIQQPYANSRHPASPALLASLLAKNIKVDREREREFFIITARHPTPEIALMMADRFSQSYINFVRGELHEVTRKAAEILRGQAAELSDSIVALQNESLGYRRKNNLVSVEANEDMLDERMKRLHLALSEVRVKQMDLEAQVARARDDLARSPLPFSNPTLANYGHNQVLREELEALKTQRDVAAGHYGPNHPKMMEIERSIRSAEDALKRSFVLAYDDVRTQAELSSASSKKLETEIAETFARSLELSALAGRFNALGQTIESKRKTYDLILQRLDKLSVDTQLPVDVLRVIDPAYLVWSLVPLKLLYGAVVALAGGLAFFATVIGVNFFDQTVQGYMDLERRLGVRVLGSIPKLSRTRKAERAHVVRDNVFLPYVETFHTIASQIDLVSGRPMPRKIVVTSALPGEGKSTAASNLAAIFTRLGWKTVLVDADFRKPVQHEIHRSKTDRGLLTWAEDGFKPGPDLLTAGGPLGLTVLPDGTTLIPTGGADVQPSRHLIAPAMTAFLERLGREFDVVVIDTPPAGVFQDALILARSCDETVFVVQEGRATTTLIARLIVDFARTNAPVLGLLLNRFRSLGSDGPVAYRQHKLGAGYYKAKVKVLPNMAASA